MYRSLTGSKNEVLSLKKINKTLNYEGSETPKPYCDIDNVSVKRAALRGRINNETSVPR